MASNLNRDPMRAWRQPRSPSNADPKLHATLFSKCEVRAQRRGPPRLSDMHCKAVRFRAGAHMHLHMLSTVAFAAAMTAGPCLATRT